MSSKIFIGMPLGKRKYPDCCNNCGLSNEMILGVIWNNYIKPIGSYFVSTVNTLHMGSLQMICFYIQIKSLVVVNKEMYLVKGN